MRTLALATILLAGLGCTNVQPLGPLAKHKPAGKPAEQDPDIPPPPSASSTAQRLVPPAMTIEAGEVTADTAEAAVRKLTNEIEYDYKTLPPPPKTAEVSRYKNGVKVN